MEIMMSFSECAQATYNRGANINAGSAQYDNMTQKHLHGKYSWFLVAVIFGGRNKNEMISGFFFVPKSSLRKD